MLDAPDQAYCPTVAGGSGGATAEGADGGRRAGVPPTNAALSTGLVGIVNVFYGVALGTFLVDGGARQILLDLSHQWMAWWAALLTAVALVWSYMGHAFYLVRYPYQVEWRPGATATDRRSTEDWRFVADLTIAGLFGLMLVLAFEPAPENGLTDDRLGWFLGLLACTRGMTLLSTWLRSLRWRTPALRRWAGPGTARAADVVFVVLPVLVVGAYLLGRQTEGGITEGWQASLLAAATGVVVVQILGDRHLAKRQFTEATEVRVSDRESVQIEVGGRSYMITEMPGGGDA
jgi:hypothetical protein